LPRNLHERLSAAANNEGVSANTLVTTFVAEGLARRDTADVPASTSSPNDLHFKSAYELRDLVRSYMQRFSAGRRDTDDLVQEVYVRVLKHGRTDPPIADYRKYLFALTRQVASDYLRRDIRKNVLHTAEDADDIEIIDKGPTPEDIVESLSRQQVLMKVLQQLPPRVRAVMSLRAGGLNNKQIAKELGLSITTVEKHQESALRKLGQPAPK
jgi:RNA polymerase sigma-70 factor (ECF subfamily)